MGEPPFAFPLTSAMGRAQWLHPNTANVHVPHGSHLTLLLIYQRCYQKMVNAYGPWGPTWSPLEEKEASLKTIFTLNGYKNPGVDVWCARYRTWDHYSLGKHTPAGDPHWVVSELAGSPRGVQILLEHPREAATLVDPGDLEATLLSKPSWDYAFLRHWRNTSKNGKWE